MRIVIAGGNSNSLSPDEVMGAAQHAADKIRTVADRSEIPTIYYYRLGGIGQAALKLLADENRQSCQTIGLVESDASLVLSPCDRDVMNTVLESRARILMIERLIDQ